MWKNIMYAVVKRTFDIIAAILALFALFIPLVSIAIIIKITSKGPIIHWSKRIGKNNSLFMMAKFRTMRIDTPQVATHLLTNTNNFITPVGQFLRKYSLDELPQLINILRGNLSFVGPRPALFNQEDLREQRTNKGVHQLKPGLTGWAQVNGRDELPIPVKVEFDEYYLCNQSFWFDIKILFLTLLKSLRGEGVTH